MSIESKIVLSNKQNGTTTEIIDNNISSSSKKFYLPNTGGKLLTSEQANETYQVFKDGTNQYEKTIYVGNKPGDYPHIRNALDEYVCKLSGSYTVRIVLRKDYEVTRSATYRGSAGVIITSEDPNSYIKLNMTGQYERLFISHSRRVTTITNIKFDNIGDVRTSLIGRGYFDISNIEFLTNGNCIYTGDCDTRVSLSGNFKIKAKTTLEQGAAIVVFRNGQINNYCQKENFIIDGFPVGIRSDTGSLFINFLNTGITFKNCTTGFSVAGGSYIHVYRTQSVMEGDGNLTNITPNTLTPSGIIYQF